MWQQSEHMVNHQASQPLPTRWETHRKTAGRALSLTANEVNEHKFDIFK